MTDIAYVVVPNSLIHVSFVSKPRPGVLGDRMYNLNDDVLDWLDDHGVGGVDWSVETGMYADERGFIRKSFITFVDDNLAMEFKLTWL
jgi:hypothetical protein